MYCFGKTLRMVFLMELACSVVCCQLPVFRGDFINLRVVDLMIVGGSLSVHQVRLD